MARENDTQAYLPRVIIVPVGVSLGVFVPPQPNQVGFILNNLTSAATLLLLQANNGSTMVGGTLVALAATFGYSIAANTQIVQQGAPAYYLTASGATATVHVLTQLSNFNGA